jgi:hypothetical protein
MQKARITGRTPQAERWYFNTHADSGPRSANMGMLVRDFPKNQSLRGHNGSTTLCEWVSGHYTRKAVREARTDALNANGLPMTAT